MSQVAVMTFIICVFLNLDRLAPTNMKQDVMKSWIAADEFGSYQFLAVNEHQQERRWRVKETPRITTLNDISSEKD